MTSVSVIVKDVLQYRDHWVHVTDFLYRYSNFVMDPEVRNDKQSTRTVWISVLPASMSALTKIVFSLRRTEFFVTSKQKLSKHKLDDIFQLYRQGIRLPRRDSTLSDSDATLVRSHDETVTFVSFIISSTKLSVLLRRRQWVATDICHENDDDIWSVTLVRNLVLHVVVFFFTRGIEIVCQELSLLERAWFVGKMFCLILNFYDYEVSEY